MQTPPPQKKRANHPYLPENCAHIVRSLQIASINTDNS